MNVRPLHDWIIVQRLEDTAPRAGDHHSRPAKEKPQQGVVLAAGLGRPARTASVPLDVKAGDTILFGNAPARRSPEGVDYLIKKEEDVLAIHEKR
jgi:chaperonin GroES